METVDYLEIVRRAGQDKDDESAAAVIYDQGGAGC